MRYDGFNSASKAAIIVLSMVAAYLDSDEAAYIASAEIDINSGMFMGK